MKCFEVTCYPMLCLFTFSDLEVLIYSGAGETAISRSAMACALPDRWRQISMIKCDMAKERKGGK